MADQQDIDIPLEIDSREMFEAAMAPEPKAEPVKAEPAEAPKPEPEGDRPRDEHGRFVATKDEAKPDDVAPAAQQAVAGIQPITEQTDAAANVPSWRLREVNEGRAAAERRAEEAARDRATLQAQMQAMAAELQALRTPKAEPVDFFANPDEALQQRLTPIEARFAKLEQDLRLSSSRTAAIAVHGAPAVMEMEKAVAKAMSESHPDIPGLAMRMRSSDDPAGIAMHWYKQTRLWEATGGDPDAYKTKVLEEALKNPEHLAKAMEAARTQAGGGTASGTRPAINLPPSLSKAPGAGMNNAAADDGDMSDRALFRHAMSR